MAKRKNKNKNNSRRTSVNSTGNRPVSLALSQHVFHVTDTLKRLAREPFSSAMTILVIAIALALPACLYLLVNNAQTLSERWHTSHDISVYVDGSVTLDRVQEMRQSLGLRKDVQLARLISSEDALSELKQDSQLDMISTAIGSNPLPHTLIISPTAELIESENANQLNALLATLQNLPDANEVQLDAQWVMKLRSMISLLKRAVWSLAVLLALGVLLVVSNTIRLHVQQRENEIQVKKLIGASNGFVRRPFLYLGFWYGFLGAVFAIILVWILLAGISGPAERLSELYASSFELNRFGFVQSLSLLFSGSLLALLGAWLAAERSIKHIDVQ